MGEALAPAKYPYHLRDVPFLKNISLIVVPWMCYPSRIGVEEVVEMGTIWKPLIPKCAEGNVNLPVIGLHVN